MALDDRDYMRERYRQRKGLGAEKMQWNDKKGRCEGAWIKPKYSGFDYQKWRFRTASQIKQHPAQKWLLLLSALSILIPAYREAKRWGWMPDTAPTVPFPSSGSVTVERDIDPKTATSRMSVKTDEANAVIQLFVRETDRLSSRSMSAGTIAWSCPFHRGRTG